MIELTAFIILIVFITLKTIGFIAWIWPVVLLPLWIYLVIYFLVHLVFSDGWD